MCRLVTVFHDKYLRSKHLSGIYLFHPDTPSCQSVSPPVCKWNRVCSVTPFVFGGSTSNMVHTQHTSWNFRIWILANSWILLLWLGLIKSDISIFYPRPVLAFGIVITCVSVCVYEYNHDNSSPIQARITKFGPEVQNPLVKVPFWGECDWPWLK